MIFLSDYFKPVCVRKLGEVFADRILIPECNGRNIVLKRQITSAGAPTERLDRYLDIIFKADRICDVPAVHSEAAVCMIDLIGMRNLRKSRIGRAVFNVFAINVKIPRSAEIILRSGAADRGEIGVTVDIDFDLSLSPPAVGFYAPVQIRADVMAVALDVIKDGVDLLVRKGIDATELCVEV